MQGRLNLRTDKKSFSGFLIVLFMLLILSLLLAVTIGVVDLSVKDVYSVILNKIFNANIGGDLKASTKDIVWLIRLPRVVLALVVGMGLSVSGCVMQAVVKNPLADPYILGISSGAALGATAATMLGLGSILGSNSIEIAAFIGAFAVSLLVQMVANIGGRSNSIRLLLSGMAISAICSAFSNFIIFMFQNKDGIRVITFWMMGSLAGAKWENILFIFPIILIVTIFFISRSRILNIMLLGDEVAVTLGTDLHKVRHVFLLLSSLMVGLAVYCAGMIGFIGLIIPHAVRMLLGTEHKRLIPVSALIGAIFLIWADVACRVIIPMGEMPIGILVAIIGAPIFLYLLAKKSYGFGERG